MSSAATAPAAAAAAAPSSERSVLRTASSFPILPFHEQILSELTAQDGLVILARGLGLPQLLFHLVLQYASSPQLVFALNLSDELQREINERLAMEEQHRQTLATATAASSASVTPRPAPVGRLKSITNAVPAAERQRLYLAGGCLAVTNRILIVDLLNKVIAPDLVSGLLLTAAHRCSDDSSEAFILRIFRQHNAHGFIKAISDEPQTFSSGFFGLDKIMKALHLRSLALYPRFHLAVQASLSPQEPDAASSLSPPSPDVHEMYQPMTPAMLLIQRALVECLDLCLSALKQENRLGSSLLHISLDSGLSTAFDSIIKTELEPVWHRVSPRSRQLVQDVTALRQAISYLINYDAVTFYRFLLALRAQCSSSTYSMWLLSEPADRLFKQAKSRVYDFESGAMKRVERDMDRERERKKAEADVLQRARTSIKQLRRQKRKQEQEQQRAAGGSGGKRKKGSAGEVEVVEVEDDEETKVTEETKAATAAQQDEDETPADCIKLVLEENPKWQLLVDILDEIQAEVKEAEASKREQEKRQQASKEERKDPEPASASASAAQRVPKAGRVLVCCSDERTCSLLRRFLQDGGRKMLKQLWTNFLFKQKRRRAPLHSSPTLQPAVQPLVAPHPQPLSGSAAPSSSPSASSPPGAPSPWAMVAAETACLRRELEKVWARRRDAKLKKYERERRRRMRREEEEKRRQIIGEDQMTLTQHVRTVQDRRREEDENRMKEEQEAKQNKKATKAQAAGGKRKPQQQKAERKRRPSRQLRDEDDEDDILRDVIKLREKRQMEAAAMDDDDDEEMQDDDGAEDEEADSGNKRKTADDSWGVLSVCDVSLHIQPTIPSAPASPSATSDSESVEESSPPSALPPSVFHEFDESILHALPGFQVVFHPSRDVDLMLYRFQPHYVVMFDPDLTLLRELEVYAASHPQLLLSVYYCQYVNSVEEQRYLSAIRQEKEAFDQLIFQKQHLVVPSEREGKSVGLSGGDISVESSAALRMPSGSVDDGGGLTRYSTFESYQLTLRDKATAVNTRRGGDMSLQVPGTVIVDVREFRSSLPSLLHSRGLTIVPVTLEVGDYVLTPALCVERKSLPDLFSSFLSGRLFRQMEMMARHYRSPVLLIEFDRRRPFSLLSKGELGAEISSRHIMARLVLLCIHFPQLRLLWSRDSHATSSLFLLLKKQQPEPEIEGVVLSVGGEGGIMAGAAGVGLVGVSGIGGAGGAAAGGGEDEDERVYSMMSFDILRKLPGVTATSLRSLVEHVSSLADLCDKKLTELMLWMGESNARKLYAFLHSDFSSLFV